MTCIDSNQRKELIGKENPEQTEKSVKARCLNGL